MKTFKRVTHPAITLECALCINRRAIQRYTWLVIGRLNGKTPFLLTYQGFGLTLWDSPVLLSEGLRKKILTMFRLTCRSSSIRPAWVQFHDLSPEDILSGEAADEHARALMLEFHRDIWRHRYLNDRDEDYVTLNVPYAEKDSAKAVGARWEPVQKVWRVKRRKDMTPFARWLS